MGPVPEPDARLVPLADRLREVELPNPRGPRPLPPPTLSPVERTDPASVKLYMLRQAGGGGGQQRRFDRGWRE